MDLQKEANMSEEYIDIYDGTGEPLGISKPKSVVHQEGLWHRSFHCWIIFSRDKGKRYIVLQKRSSNKKTWPNRFDISAAGHYTSGEGIEGGLREIREEIGITVDQVNLINLGVRVCIEEFDPAMVNHEFQDVFFLIDDRPLTKYRMSPTEVTGLVSVNVDEAIELFAGSIDMITAVGHEIEGNADDFIVKKKSFEITTSQFIPTLDNYNYKIMVLAKRALLGEQHLLI